MPGTIGRIESDSHADTCCAGRNCVVLSFTNQVIDVYAFCQELGPMKSVPIASVATLATDKDGREVILVINEALWFGQQMDHSLISSNQVRANEVELWDNPCDSLHEMCIYNPASDYPVPLEMDGIVAFAETRAPTTDEIRTLPHVELTSEVPWKPELATYNLIPFGQEYVGVRRQVSFADTVKTAPFEGVTRESTVIFDCLDPDRLCSPSLSEHDWSPPTTSSIHDSINFSTSDSTFRNISSVLSSSFADQVSALYPREPGLTSLLRKGGFQVKSATRRVDMEQTARINKVITRSMAFKAPARDKSLDDAMTDQTNRVYRPGDFSKTRHGNVTQQDIMSKWNLSRKAAEKTLEHTRQAGTRHSNMPLTRQFPGGLNHNRYNRLKGNWYCDVFFNSVKSVDGHTCAAIFYNGEYAFAKPLTTKEHVWAAAYVFVPRVGMPEHLITDGAGEYVGPKTKFRKFFTKNGNNCKISVTQPGQPRYNRAEHGVMWMKKRMKLTMRNQNVHPRLWSYLLIYETDVYNRIWKAKHNRTGWESVTGNQPDISEYLDFDFYGWVWHWDWGAKKAQLGRWLGVNRHVGEALSSYVLRANGKIVTCTTVQRVTDLDVLLPATQRLMALFDKEVVGHLDSKTAAIKIEDEVSAARILDAEEPEDDDKIVFECDTLEESDERDTEQYNAFIGSKFKTQRGGKQVHGRVKDRVRNEAGSLMGKHNANPLLDTSRYVVEYEDGSLDELSANIIAEAIYAQVDDEGRDYVLLDAIVDHKRDSDVALDESNGFEVKSNGNRIPKRTTMGWKLKARWKDGGENWIPLKDLKDSNPLEVVTYAQNTGLVDEPAFAWWVPHFIARRDRIVSKLGTSKYWRTTEKMGITVPRTIEQAYALDKEDGTTLWQDAIAKEMKHVLPAFKDGNCTIDQIKNHKALIGYQKIRCHLIFDVKMDFTRKARFVAGGHVTDPPDCITYSSVVSRETVRISFLLAALNDLDVCAADIGNAYLNADCAEKIYTIAGREFGPQLQGKVLIIHKALYGLKSSGAAWRQHLSSSIKSLGFQSSRGDPDLYLRAACKPDGTEYYEYLLVYVDDILCISHDTTPIMRDLATRYRLKEGSIGSPTRYLGADIGTMENLDGKNCWAMSSDSYLQNAIKIVEGFMDGEGVSMRNPTSPFHRVDYHPELDDTPLLGPRMIARYQQLIGMLRWACELGRIDMLLEVALMSAFNAAPRQGHLNELYHIFAYLKKAGARCLLFDPARPTYNVDFCDGGAWEEFYEVEPEPTPADMPKARGKSVVMTCWVDASHASQRVTMRSHTGIFITLNNAPVAWYSKRQNTVESSTFGSEFVALRVATEMCQAMRYKLRMFGVAIDGPTSVMCDNQSVQKNVSIPTSQLGKKHNAICYHKVRESVAAGWIRVGWVESKNNLADLFTKVLNIPTRVGLIRKMTRRWRTTR